MNILDLLRGAQGGAAIDNLARQFDLDPAQTEAVLAQIGPELGYNLEKNTLSRGGIADLVEMIGSGQYERYSEDGTAMADPATIDVGNEILGQILGSKTKSRALAARASSSTGISATLIKAMLPYIASILMGSLSKSMQGGLGDLMKNLPQLGGGSTGKGRSRKRNARRASQNNGPLSMPGSGSGSASMSADDDYSGSPLPLPGSRSGADQSSDNPYGEIGDVLRRGGSGGSTLWTMARNLLGGIIGFQSKGVVGWFIRLIVMRFGWRIVKAIFSGMFSRR